uniref:(northern house mosquito) hypothetical protein n=1 Tax=Culex pipiens TaxID=7175 RepID=A0A8D8AD08_CULPI
MQELARHVDAETMAKFVEYIRGALRLLKSMPNRGITFKGSIGEDSDIVFAAPLIRWIHTDSTKSNDEWLNNHSEEAANQPPHIVCLAPSKLSGQMYIVFNGYSLSVGNLFPYAMEILFKLIFTLKLTIPPHLMKLNDLISLQIFKNIQSTKYVTTAALHKRLNELFDN